MRLLGRANWWAPAPLRRLYARYGIREDDGPAPAAGRGAGAPAGAASRLARTSPRRATSGHPTGARTSSSAGSGHRGRRRSGGGHRRLAGAEPQHGLRLVQSRAVGRRGRVGRSGASTASAVRSRRRTGRAARRRCSAHRSCRTSSDCRRPQRPGESGDHVSSDTPTRRKGVRGTSRHTDVTETGPCSDALVRLRCAAGPSPRPRPGGEPDERCTAVPTAGRPDPRVVGERALVGGLGRALHRRRLRGARAVVARSGGRPGPAAPHPHVRRGGHRRGRPTSTPSWPGGCPARRS